MDENTGSSEWQDRIFLYDGGGHVRALTDLEGNITDTFSYDAYGNLLQPSSLFLPTSYLYRGERYDADFGQYYLRARFYDANLGRFHTLDEYEGRTGEPLSLHKYLYAHANPVTGWDPSGRMMSLSEVMVSCKIAVDNQILRIGPAFAAGGAAIGRVWNALGLAAQNAAYQIMLLFGRLQVVTSVAIKSYHRVIDFSLQIGTEVALLEAKYSIPSRLGNAMTRLVGQMNAIISSNMGQAVLWTYKPPTAAQMNLFFQQMGSNASRVQLVHGMDGLYRWIEWFFNTKGGV